LKNKENLSFSKEVAETLGIECAVILDLYKNNKLGNISSHEDLQDSLKKELTFINETNLNDSINKLIAFNLINLNKNKEASDNIYSPPRNNESRKLDISWMPSSETLDIINMAEISNDFLTLKLKEFKIYWIERGQKKNNWNISFLNFIRIEWAKENNSNRSLPYPIDEKWLPSEDVFDILNLSDITKDSALKYLREFILYWKDNGAAFTTWNSKFIDHVKRRHMINDNIGKNEKDKKHSEPGKYTQDFKTRKNDDSWANEINLE
tara:strand:- start:351 stop:1145 length:795 start_codon:yes stop_codon:yes gene_type:complete